MRKLSATIITLNEEHNIGRCIDSLKGIVDEVIVVDSSSTDRTVEIAEGKGAKVLNKEWCGYSDQKNWANEQASNDLILSLDADEELSSELFESIKEALYSDCDNFKFARKANYCGVWISHTGWYPDTKFRIFDRRRTRWEGTIHERLESSGPEPLKLKGDLLHYSYRTISDHVDQSNKFSQLSALALLQSGQTPRVFKIIVNPVVRFIKFYFTKLGFLDGRYGFIISAISAYEVFLKYAKHWQMKKSRK
jgi:glycosyltransferase involved in cell wall biosynthesis